MRDFESCLLFCHVSQREASRNRFYNSAYMDAFYRVEHYENNNQNGHFKQLFYAIFDFLTEHPNMISQITTPPFEISSHPLLLSRWSSFLLDEANSTRDYDVILLAEKLPNSCGGVLSGGGGWSPTLKILFPVVAKYLDAS